MPDPRQVARNMFDRLDLPSLRIDMNPRLGMVAVPTWFWVEGYGGDLIPLTDNLTWTHQECHAVVDRGEGGAVVLDASNRPASHTSCQTIVDTLTVEVRAWPKSYLWMFGDEATKTVPCPGLAGCPAGVGLPFSSSMTASPIAHAYRWSSLGSNGAADAYTVHLSITFSAEYRFSMNGAPPGDWQGLDNRDLGWSASHQVQEAQAVLTHP